jgi:hypothetical protein
MASTHHSGFTKSQNALAMVNEAHLNFMGIHSIGHSIYSPRISHHIFPFLDFWKQKLGAKDLEKWNGQI